MLPKSESVKIYWLSVKFDWLLQWRSTDLTVKNIFSLFQSMKINWFDSENYVCTDESVKRQISDSISENLTDSDSESVFKH